MEFKVGRAVSTIGVTAAAVAGFGASGCATEVESVSAGGLAATVSATAPAAGSTVGTGPTFAGRSLTAGIARTFVKSGRAYVSYGTCDVPKEKKTALGRVTIREPINDCFILVSSNGLTSYSEIITSATCTASEACRNGYVVGARTKSSFTPGVYASSRGGSYTWPAVVRKDENSVAFYDTNAVVPGWRFLYVGGTELRKAVDHDYGVEAYWFDHTGKELAYYNEPIPMSSSSSSSATLSCADRAAQMGSFNQRSQAEAKKWYRTATANPEADPAFDICVVSVTAAGGVVGTIGNPGIGTAGGFLVGAGAGGYVCSTFSNLAELEAYAADAVAESTTEALCEAGLFDSDSSDDTFSPPPADNPYAVPGNGWAGAADYCASLGKTLDICEYQVLCGSEMTYTTTSDGSGEATVTSEVCTDYYLCCV